MRSNTIHVGWYIEAKCKKLSYDRTFLACPNNCDSGYGTYCSVCGTKLADKIVQHHYIKTAGDLTGNSGATWRGYASDWTKSVPEEDVLWFRRNYFELIEHPKHQTTDIIVPFGLARCSEYTGTVLEVDITLPPLQSDLDRLKRMMEYETITAKFGVVVDN